LTALAGVGFMLAVVNAMREHSRLVIAWSCSRWDRWLLARCWFGCCRPVWPRLLITGARRAPPYGSCSWRRQRQQLVPSASPHTPQAQSRTI